MAETTGATGGNPVALSDRPAGLSESVGIVAENVLARKALRSMLDGSYTPNGAAPQGFGGWADFVAQCHNAYTARGAAGARAVVNVNPAALRLLSGDDEPEPQADLILHTDMGNGRRFALRHADRAAYVTGWGWMIWDGKRWESDETGAAARRVPASGAA